MADSLRSSASRAVATKRGVPRGSRDEKTRAQLLEEARAKDIRGRSTMRKAELIEALRKAG